MALLSTRVIFLTLGFIVALFGSCFIFGFPMLTIAGVREWAIKLKNDTMSYKNWVALRRPCELSFFIFNITNPDEVMRGAKPNLDEVGPFTYVYRRQRVNVVFTGKNRVSSNTISFLHFSRLRSVEDDVKAQVITPNVPLMMSIQTTEGGIRKLSPTILKVYKMYPWQGLFVKKSVHETLFGGYTDPLLYETNRDHSYYQGVSIYQNGTKSARITILTGRNDIDEIGYLDKYNNMDNFYFYGNYPRCSNFSKVLGGNEFVTNINDDDEDDLITFLEPIGRFVDFKIVDDDYDYEDFNWTIDSKRYVQDPYTYFNKYDNPWNECYESPAPTPPGIESRSVDRKGLPSGVFDARRQYGKPILYSNPHFLHGDPFLVNSVNGLEPVKQLHESIHIAQPDLSVTLMMIRNYQMNVQLTPNAAEHDAYTYVPKIIYPIAWSKMECRASRKTVKNVYLITDASWIVGFSVGPVILVLGLVVMAIGFTKEDDEPMILPEPRRSFVSSPMKDDSMASSQF